MIICIVHGYDNVRIFRSIYSTDYIQPAQMIITNNQQVHATATSFKQHSVSQQKYYYTIMYLLLQI